jgi:hypothetical protein
VLQLILEVPLHLAALVDRAPPLAPQALELLQCPVLPAAPQVPVDRVDLPRPVLPVDRSHPAFPAGVPRTRRVLS